MVNDCFACLLNRLPNTLDSAVYPGDIFIPKGYQPVPLPGWLGEAYARIIPPNADHVFKNFRVSHLVSLALASDVGEYVLYNDTRIVIPYPRSLSGYVNVFKPNVTASNGGIQGCLKILNEDDNKTMLSGRSKYSVTISTVKTGQHYDITVKDNVVNASTQGALIYNNGVSTVYGVPGSGLLFQLINLDQVSSLEPSWSIKGYAEVITDVNYLFHQCLKCSESSVALLFSGDAPLSDLREIWETHPESVTRLSAFVVAVALQIGRLQR